MRNFRSFMIVGYVILLVLAQSVATTEGGTPDLVVESVAMSPANPLAGDAVTFSCKVLNIGGGPTPEGVVIGVAYFIDGVYETYGIVDGPLRAGGSVTHEAWKRVNWGTYNGQGGETRPARGDIDGDGKDEIVIGLAPVAGDPSTPGGWFEVLDDDYTHLAWGRINWGVYNNANGESWPACGDVDGDGQDEIIVGLGSYPADGGWFEIFEYGSGQVTHKAWKRVNWGAYNGQGGETRPACGDVDRDGYDEIIIGLDGNGGGWLEVFDDALAGYVHSAWSHVHWGGYCSANGESWPACGDVDGDGQDEIIVGLGSYPADGGWFEIFDYSPNSVTVGTSSVSWSSTEGFHTLTALVDDVNRITESNETNNDYSTPSFTVFTEQANRFGMNIDPANPAGNPTAEELKTIGVRWVRIEWKADFGGFDYYDSIISAYRSAGLHVLLLVDYMSVPGKPPSDAPTNVWEEYVSKFKSGLRDIANHYRDGVDAWEIWNEPDLLRPGDPYDPGVPANHFGQMLKDAVEVIRPVSSRPIIVGGLASGNPNYLQQASNAVGGLTVDAVGVHPYGQRAPDNWPSPTWGFGNMSDLLDGYLVFGLPLWLTEIGTSDEPIQADYLENVFALTGGEYAWGVPVVLWFCWSDGMVPPFGVLFTDGTVKDSYFRYETIAPQW